MKSRGGKSALGCEGSSQRGMSRSGLWGALRQTSGCSSQREGRVQGPQGDAQGVQDKEAGEQSENEGSEARDRAGGACVTPVRGGGGGEV